MSQRPWQPEMCLKGNALSLPDVIILVFIFVRVGAVHRDLLAGGAEESPHYLHAVCDGSNSGRGSIDRRVDDVSSALSKLSFQERMRAVRSLLALN